MQLAKFSNRKEKVEIDRTVSSVEIDLDFTQLYDCFLLLSMNIKSTISFQVLFFLLRIMGRDNNVMINKRAFEIFNQQRTNIGQKVIAEQTFYKCIRDLIAAKIMNKLPPNRGMYFMNPYGVWKADKKERIAYLIEDSGKGQSIALNPINLLLNDDQHQYNIDTIQENPTDAEIEEYFRTTSKPKKKSFTGFNNNQDDV